MKVGVVGGHSIFGIGTQEEMQMFFDAIAKYSHLYDPKTNYDVLLDRLYKRYLRLEELGAATELLNKIKGIFAKVAVPSEYAKFAVLNSGTTSFKVKSNNLAEFFETYIELIHKAITTAIYCYNSSQEDEATLYEKVMICYTDTVPVTIAGLRPDALYDNLEGEPYWKRQSEIDWDTDKK